MVLKAIEIEDNLEARKFNILLQAVTLDRTSGTEVQEFNQSWRKLYEALTSRSTQSSITEEDEQKLKNMFKSINDEERKPRSFKMKVGRADKSAEFDSKSIGELVKLSRGSEDG